MVTTKGVSTKANAFVIQGASNNLLGKKEIKALDIIGVVHRITAPDIYDRYPYCFKD